MKTITTFLIVLVCGSLAWGATQPVAPAKPTAKAPSAAASAHKAAPAARPATAPSASPANKVPAGGATSTISTNVLEDNPIIAGTLIKTEWHKSRNPFQSEAKRDDAPAAATVEQLQVLGISKMPDEDNIIRTYVFLTKTSESREEEKPEPRPAAKPGPAKPGTSVTKEVTYISHEDTYTLQSFPEILEENTTPTEEQIQQSSVVLGGDVLWFIGSLELTNKTVAVFWPYGAYPVKEESLRQFEIANSLRDLNIHRTKAGERIGGDTTLSAMSRAKLKQQRDAMQGKLPGMDMPTAPSARPPTVPSAQPAAPSTSPAPKPATSAPAAAKPQLSGNPERDVDAALNQPSKRLQ